MRRIKGFTLLEVVVTIGLVAILAAFAVPSFRTSIQNNQLAACSNKFVSAIQLAKSTAVTSRTRTQIARVASTTGIRFQVTDEGNSSQVLEVFECLGNDISISLSPDVANIQYGSTGFRADGNGQVQLTVCNELSKGKLVTVTTGGGVSTKSLGNC
ncbi:GspH/FimT family pseudopilin [Pleionea sp. CnH1-48]|uniref:GspH/FimT family pseudopilin n=1 Tax=Pleionea sp. CnH1-48 TaxID=2954494 RepID=UPI002096DB81|nr:GspH/FimT family pseudopilin [Pleionea sp. CnH1-48]MCO7222873.1 GspH/FimT family pseudopilin [Pleionea sp. CnH1-48]